MKVHPHPDPVVRLSPLPPPFLPSAVGSLAPLPSPRAAFCCWECALAHGRRGGCGGFRLCGRLRVYRFAGPAVPRPCKSRVAGLTAVRARALLFVSWVRVHTRVLPRVSPPRVGTRALLPVSGVRIRARRSLLSDRSVVWWSTTRACRRVRLGEVC